MNETRPAICFVPNVATAALSQSILYQVLTYTLLTFWTTCNLRLRYM